MSDPTPLGYTLPGVRTYRTEVGENGELTIHAEERGTRLILLPLHGGPSVRDLHKKKETRTDERDTRTEGGG